MKNCICGLSHASYDRHILPLEYFCNYIYIFSLLEKYYKIMQSYSWLYYSIIIDYTIYKVLTDRNKHIFKLLNTIKSYPVRKIQMPKGKEHTEE